ncbi:head-tail connector protein [Aerococcaceae bacterium zg-ZUI334]|uniref:head-tail connector protein n=1 Tax=Aerococcaceae bacterium zg-252 TaxID=2796928 RepID=UPI001BA0B212|nr:head-tail connector protein [Aerococcaceae bacterium zg-ZUI334]
MGLTLDDVKQYLRIDSSDDDSLLESLMVTAKHLCMHILRVDDLSSALLLSEEVHTAMLYAIAYLYEHREEANHKDLTLTLRSLLFGLRKVDF